MTSLLLKVQTHVRVNPPSDGIEFMPPTTLSLPGNPAHYTASHIHKIPETLQGPTNREFYRKALSGMVEACLAGQSFTVLFCSAPNCGRSHTLYGGNLSGGDKEKGVVELFAQELLERKDVMVQASSFSVIGEELYETVDAEKRVELREFAPPVGVLTTATMFPVESSAHVLLQPSKKNVLATYVTQLFVCRPLEGAPSLRSSYSVISFVDLPGFVPPILTADIQSLVLSVERAAKGNDPLFGQCKLTKILENSISSSRTLIAVATISGRREASEGNAVALAFLEKAGRMRQVTTLVQMIPPRCFIEAIRGVQEVRDKAVAQLQEARQSGLSEVFAKVSALLRDASVQVPAVLTRTDETVATARKEMRLKFDEEALLFQAQLQNAKEKHEENLLRAHQLDEDSSLMNELSAERKALHEKEKEISKGNMHLQQINACSLLQREQLQNRYQKNKEAAEAFLKQRDLHSKNLKALSKKIDFVASRAVREQRKQNCMREMEEIMLKKQKCEQLLAEASVAAKTANSVCRDERERRSKVARLTQAEDRVNVLRQIIENSVESATATPGVQLSDKCTGRLPMTSVSPSSHRLQVPGMQTPSRTTPTKHRAFIAESPKTSRTPTHEQHSIPSPQVVGRTRSTSANRFPTTGGRTPTQPGFVNANRKRYRTPTPSNVDPGEKANRKVKSAKKKSLSVNSASANKGGRKKTSPRSVSKKETTTEEAEEIIGIAARRRADQAAAVSLF